MISEIVLAFNQVTSVINFDDGVGIVSEIKFNFQMCICFSRKNMKHFSAPSPLLIIKAVTLLLAACPGL